MVCVMAARCTVYTLHGVVHTPHYTGDPACHLFAYAVPDEAALAAIAIAALKIGVVEVGAGAPVQCACAVGLLPRPDRAWSSPAPSSTMIHYDTILSCGSELHAGAIGFCPPGLLGVSKQSAHAF